VWENAKSIKNLDKTSFFSKRLIFRVLKADDFLGFWQPIVTLPWVHLLTSAVFQAIALKCKLGVHLKLNSINPIVE
jgi:hypothetical protein